MSPLRYIAVFAASGMTVIVLALGLAVLVDPAHIFRVPVAYAEMAHLLVKGTPVGGLDSPRHRLINRALVARLTDPPSTVLLGSSRVQPFSPSAAGWTDSLNLAVEGGNLADHLYVYGLLRENDLSPEHLIITVDPYIFSPDGNYRLRRGTQATTRRVTDELGVGCFIEPNMWAELSWLPQVLTLDYLIEVAKVLKADLHNRERVVAFVPDPELRSTAFVKRPDGSVIFSTEITGRDQEYIDSYAQTVLEHPVGRGLAFDNLDECKLAVFQAFIELLRRDGINIVLAMLPYHPDAFVLLDSRYRMLAQSETFLVNLGAEQSLPVIGSYDPTVSQCTSVEFLDMHHPRTSCIHRILSDGALQLPNE